MSCLCSSKHIYVCRRTVPNTHKLSTVAIRLSSWAMGDRVFGHVPPIDASKAAVMAKLVLS